MLSVSDLHKTYGEGRRAIAALNGVSFSVAEGATLGVLGPSGCGKSTLLRLIAGLDAPDRGEIRIRGAIVSSAAENIDVPAEKRNVGLVFQSYAIWPHMSVFENVAFPLRVQRVGSANVRRNVMAMLESVALADTAERRATELSGGQQQRLALARALVARPKVLLLDEPLSSLDARLREQMRVELRRLQREHGMTTIFVTHDQAEGLSLADTVAVMNDGRLLQVGSPRQIYEAPASLRVADFIGSINLLEAEPTGRSSAAGEQLLQSAWGEIATTARTQSTGSGRVVLGIRPENLRIRDTEEGANVFRGVAKTVMYYGSHQELFIDIGGRLVTAVAPPKTRIKTGEHLLFSVDAADVAMLSTDEATGKRLE